MFPVLVPGPALRRHSLVPPGGAIDITRLAVSSLFRRPLPQGSVDEGGSYMCSILCPHSVKIWLNWAQFVLNILLMNPRQVAERTAL